MMFSRLGVSSTFLTYNIFNLQWVYRDVTPPYTEEHLSCQAEKSSGFLFSFSKIKAYETLFHKPSNSFTILVNISFFNKRL